MGDSPPWTTSEDEDHDRASASSREHEVDAIHPMFNAYLDQRVEASTSTEDDYYCYQCELYFPKSVEAVVEHFRNAPAHRPSCSCLYCNGPVFEYYLGQTKRLFHACVPDKTRVRPK